MAIPGTSQTYDLATGIKLDIENLIHMVSPFDVPLQGMYGADGLSALSTDTTNEVKVEWLEESLLTPTTTLSTNYVTASTSLVMATGGGINFQTGDVIQIDSEQMNITAISTDTFTVTRGWASSTATTHATSATVIALGSALAEGSDPPSARVADRSDVYNYTQIFGPVAITVSGTEQAIAKYGLTSTEFDHQVVQRLREQAITLERALINGRRYVGTGSVGRSMGGIDYYISTNADTTTTTSITEAAYLTQAQACFDAGGNPNRLMMGSKQKRIFSGFHSDLIRYQQATSDRGQIVEYYDSDYGRVTMVLNRWAQVNQAYLFAREQATIVTLRPMQFEMLAKTGDSIKGQIVGEKSLRFRLQTHAAKFTALT